jgi:hypothetical protein
MPDLDSTSPPSRPAMFAEPTPPRAFPTTAVAIAATAIVILAAFLVLLARRPATPPATALPAAAYASNLIFTNLHMSDATSGSGGRLIYIEGHVANHGPAIVTGVTLQLAFANDAAMPPQIESAPLSLIYMREPYVDTHLVSAAPLAPGAEADFRLIFDDVSDNWNQQLPHLNATRISTR